jgi:hypothetical protein
MDDVEGWEGGEFEGRLDYGNHLFVTERRVRV